jgi:hypothetical protein
MMTNAIDTLFDALDLGGISESEVMDRGQTREPISHDKVVRANRRVEETGTLKRLAAWRQQDYPAVGVGGRPKSVSDRAILVGLVLLAGENSPQLIRTLTTALQYRLSDESRSLLGLQAGTDEFANHLVEHKRWYNNTHNAFHRMLSLMDPFPQSRYRSLTYTEVKERLDAHDPVRELLMKERLDDFTNDFLRMTFQEQPRHIRRLTQKIDVSFDQTFIKPPTKKGFSKKKLAVKIAEEKKKHQGELPPGPVDVFAGWYPKAGNHPDFKRGSKESVERTDTKKDYSDIDWGWTVNIAVRVDSEQPGKGRFPQLAISATLSQPNINVSEEAVSMMKYALISTGLDAGISDADKAYFANAKVDRLHGPTAELGFTPSTDYRIDRLGVQGGKAGAQYIEGGIYCPGMPVALKNATKDLVENKIDEATFQERRKQRANFELQAKEKPDEKGRTPLRCPAIGKSPTVTCPLRELLVERASRTLVEVAEEDLPDIVDKICQQHSVSFAKEDNIRQNQAFEYRSKEWDKFHRHARNSIESLNGQVKDSDHEAIEDSTRRRVRGFAAAQVFVTILLTNYNLRKIAAFIREQIVAEDRATRGLGPVEQKDRPRDALWANNYTGTKGRSPSEGELVGTPLKT